MLRHFYQRTIAGINISKIVMAGTVIGVSSCNTHDIPADPGMENEEVSISVTRWTENVELFVEFSPFVKGEESQFAAHFTDLTTYKPISDAVVTVSLQGENDVSKTVNKPSSAGIFTPVLTPGQTGIFQLSFDIEYGSIAEHIEAGQVTVFASLEEAVSNVPQGKEGDITFLKEQAWKTEFGVSQVARQVMHERIKVAGEVVNYPSKITTISSTAGGMLVFTREFLPGILVNKNDKIGVVVGKDVVAGVNAEENLEHVFLNAKASLALARANYERQKQLHEELVISTIEFEQHQLVYDLAQSEFRTVSNNYIESMGGIALIASTSGYVQDVDAQSGDYLEVGEPVLSIIPVNNKLLHLDVPLAYYSKKESITRLRWQKAEKWHDVEGSVVSYSPQVESGDAFYSIWFNIGLTDIVPGKYVHAEIIFSTKETTNITVPTQSILEDYGTYSVIVQITGESFEKREITLGRRNSEFTEVLAGLNAGEMVVVAGAYQVKMAGMSGEAPAHGHEH